MQPAHWAGLCIVKIPVTDTENIILWISKHICNRRVFHISSVQLNEDLMQLYLYFSLDRVAYTSNNDIAVCILKYVVLNGLLALQT